MSIQREPSGFTRLTTGSGVSMVVSTFGARIVELWVPDRNGELGNVVVGLPTPQHYADRANLVWSATLALNGLIGLPAGVNFLVTGAVLIAAATIDALSRKRSGGGVRV